MNNDTRKEKEALLLKMKKTLALVTAVTTVSLVSPAQVSAKTILTNNETTVEEPVNNNNLIGATVAKSEIPTNSVIIFNDVSALHWALIPIHKMKQAGIIRGYEDGDFKADKNISRAEFATMLVKALGLSMENPNSSFTDLSDAEWARQNIVTAFKNGLISGVGNNKFDPTKSITRQDAACMLARALPETETLAETNFTDENKISPYAKEAVKKLVSAKILKGYNDGSFKPLDEITRAEAAKMFEGLLLALGKPIETPTIIKVSGYGDWKYEDPLGEMTLEKRETDNITRRVSLSLVTGPLEAYPLTGQEEFSGWIQRDPNLPHIYTAQLRDAMIAHGKWAEGDEVWVELYNEKNQLMVICGEKQEGVRYSNYKINTYQALKYQYEVREIEYEIVYRPSVTLEKPIAKELKTT